MRGAFFVIGICLVVSVFLAWQVKRSMQTDLVGAQDLVLGLIYFMEQHDGRFPASQEEFVSSSVVRVDEAGAYHIVPPAETRYSRTVHDYPLTDLARFEIQWGADLDTLTINDRGKVLDANGREVKLLEWPASPPSGKVYSGILLIQHQQIRQRLAEQQGPPATASAPVGG